MRYVVSSLLGTALALAGARSRAAARGRAPGAAGASRRRGRSPRRRCSPGEVKPRHEADLGISHRRQDRRAPRRRRRAGEEGAGARAPRSCGRRACRRRPPRRRSRRPRPKSDFAQAEIRALPEPAPAEIHQRQRARPEAQRDATPTGAKFEQAQAQPRGQSQNQAELRDAGRRRGRRGHVGERRAGPGRRGRATGRDASRATDEREVAIGVPENRIGELKSARSARRRAVGESAASCIPARVREISPAVDPVTRTFAVRIAVPDADASRAMGHDGERRACSRRGMRASALVPLDVDLPRSEGKPAVWVYDPATRQGEPARRRARPVPRGRRRHHARLGPRRLDRGGGRAQASAGAGRAAVRGAGQAGRRRRRPRGVERTPARSRLSETLHVAPIRRRRTASLALQSLRVGAQPSTARALYLIVVFALDRRARVRRSSASRRTRRSRSR